MKQFIDVATKEVTTPTTGKRTATLLLLLLLGGVVVASSQAIKMLEENLKKYEYALRHSGVSYYIRHGVPLEVVSRMAGHKTVAIADAVYYQRLMSQKVDAVSAYLESKKSEI